MRQPYVDTLTINKYVIWFLAWFFLHHNSHLTTKQGIGWEMRYRRWFCTNKLRVTVILITHSVTRCQKTAHLTCGRWTNLFCRRKPICTALLCGSEFCSKTDTPFWKKIIYGMGKHISNEDDQNARHKTFTIVLRKKITGESGCVSSMDPQASTGRTDKIGVLSASQWPIPFFYF